MIEVKNLGKRYGTQIAVDNLNFSIKKGEVVGFLGPNGAGKSTTMNMITGYIPSSEGSVTVDGHDILKEPNLVKKSIGYLPEVPPLYPDMYVREYLNFVADLKSVDKKKKAEMIDEIMQVTGIKERQHQLIKQLSKGYKQRVGLAGAIMGYPKVIILDEPTVGLDPVQMMEIRDLIKRLSKNHTVILSSHILSEVSAVCDKIMIINSGKLVVSDTTENLKNQMQTSFTISLLVKGSEEAVKEAFMPIKDQIKEIVFTKKENQELHILITGEDKEIREKIFYALADAKCPILEMKTSTKTLEDIFLEATKEVPKAEIEAETEAETEETVKEVEENQEGGEQSDASDL